MTINQVMRSIPGNEKVIVREYTTGNFLEEATAEYFCESMSSNCCVGFNRTWEVYGIRNSTDGVFTLDVCQPDKGNARKVTNRLRHGDMRELQYLLSKQIELYSSSEFPEVHEMLGDARDFLKEIYSKLELMKMECEVS